MTSKILYILGGGTMSHVRNHLSLCAPAYGTAARTMSHFCHGAEIEHKLFLTKMADHCSKCETDLDIINLVDRLLLWDNTGGIIFNVAVPNYHGTIGDVESGKTAERISDDNIDMRLTLADKIVSTIKNRRPDVVLASFKTLHTDLDANSDLTSSFRGYAESHNSDLVLINEIKNRDNFIFDRELNKVTKFTDRNIALSELVKSVHKLMINDELR